MSAIRPSASRSAPATVVVAGIGNDLRGDDGVGPAVLRRLTGLWAEDGARCRVVEDPLDLVSLWDGCELAVVVDATRSGAPPGTVRVLELDPRGAGAQGASTSVGMRPSSTHSLGLATALGMACALGSAPRRVVVVGIEGAAFAVGAALTPAVAAALPGAVALVLRLVEEHAPCA